TPHDTIDHLDEARGGKEGIVALIHRGGARVIGEAGDGHVPLPDADDAFDDADVDLARVEDAALLDVQLEVSRDVALRALDSIELRRFAAEVGMSLHDLRAGRR